MEDFLSPGTRSSCFVMRHTFLKMTQVWTDTTLCRAARLVLVLRRFVDRCRSLSPFLPRRCPRGPIPLPHICGEKGGRSSPLLHAHLRPKKCTPAPFSKETFVSASFLDISLLPVTGRQRASRCWAEPLLRLSVSTVSQPSS